MRRLKPSFLIIGGIKCGSTSLFRYLIEHPNVLPGKYKEPSFFNNKNLLKAVLRFPKYLENFPPKFSEEAIELNWPILTEDGEIEETVFRKSRSKNERYLTCDASATYNFSAKPSVVKTMLPKAKIIFLLRNPSLRFISHWRMFQRFNKEGREGYDVGDLITFIKEEISAHINKRSTRIIQQGLYYDIIHKWSKSFDGDQFMILKSSDLLDHHKANDNLNRIAAFLELKPFDFSNILNEQFNVSPKTSINKEAKSLLDSFYKESNSTLKKQLNIDIDEE